MALGHSTRSTVVYPINRMGGSMVLCVNEGRTRPSLISPHVIRSHYHRPLLSPPFSPRKER